MLYIEQTNTIFSQENFESQTLQAPRVAEANMLKAIEPKYDNIPRGILRRMGKAVRLGVGTALPMIKEDSQIDGIIIGTANGGMEDCIKFLNQIIQYEEGRLTPTNFVQSTPNAIAAQIGLLSSNKNYNITHVHRGLAFEHAMIDAQMRLQQYPDHKYLVGGIDEISAYNYNIDFLNGWYKQDSINSGELYHSQTEGSIAGEGAAMFLVGNTAHNAICKIEAIHHFHTTSRDEQTQQIQVFLENNVAQVSDIDLFISGENGDIRLLPFYEQLESMLGIKKSMAVLRYKAVTGEYPTSIGLAVSMGCAILKSQQIPTSCLKYEMPHRPIKSILIYNTYHGRQHSLWLLKNI